VFSDILELRGCRHFRCSLTFADRREPGDSASWGRSGAAPTSRSMFPQI